MYKQLLVACCLGLTALSLSGCVKNVTYNSSNQRIEAPMLSFGPAQKLVAFDNEVMLPSLELAKGYQKVKAEQRAEWVKKALADNQAHQKNINSMEIIRLNDQYIYFAKKYLQVQQQYLTMVLAVVETKDNVKRSGLDQKLKQFEIVQLEDAKSNFLAARKQFVSQKSECILSSLDEKQLHKGMTYVELRELIKKPGNHLESITIPALQKQAAKKIEPVLWVDNDKFLYVEFVNGKSDSWKLYNSLYFGTEVPRKIREQVDSWENDILQPAWKLYWEYVDAKNKLAKQKIYNEAAAKQQKAWLDKAVPRIAYYRQQLAKVPKDVPGTNVYVQQADVLLKQLEERLQCAQRLASDNKDRKFIQDNINRGNHLEGWEIWRTYFVYVHAKTVILDGKPNYIFPQWTKEHFAKKPWVGSLMHWFRMPSTHVHRHLELDPKNSKCTQRHDINVWVHDDGYFYGQFVDDRLVKWQYEKFNEGFWN